MESVDFVINFSDPYSVENYYHRIGRTARFGRYGISFLIMSKTAKIKFFSTKKYKLKIQPFSLNFKQNYPKKLIDGINERLRAKKTELEAEEKKVKSEMRRGVKRHQDVDKLMSWVDIETALFDEGNFRYFGENQQNSEIGDFGGILGGSDCVEQVGDAYDAPDKALERRGVDTGLKSAQNGRNKGSEKERIEGLKFEQEMIEMEIERLEKEERELLGLRKGEKLSEIHFLGSKADTNGEQIITLGKRLEPESGSGGPDEHPVNDSTEARLNIGTESKFEENQVEASFEDFKRLVGFLECPRCVENFERIQFMTHPARLPGFGPQGRKSVFMGLIQDLLG